MDFSKVEQFMNDMPRRGVPGCDLAVSLNGETVYRKTVGYADAEMTRPLADKSISWIFSCSKVITCLGAMRLVEKGKISLDDPVSKYFPEFEHMKILDKKTGVITDSTVPMTVEHLFTMRGGISYDINSEPLKEARAKEGASTLDIIRAMAKMPLNFEPGSHYQYSLCHDILAGIVEVVSGMRFSEFLQKYMFDPLGLKDIGFRPTEEQKSRFCDQFTYKNGCNKAIYRGPTSNSYILTPDYDSGGAGLFSTVDDYMKIISVIACGGKTADGYSLLRPETIDLLTVSHLEGDILNDFTGGRLYGYGWGLCGRVHRDPVVSCSKAPVGEFGWDGAAGAFSMIDTKNHVALYLGTNLFGFVYGYNFVHPYLRNLVYEALEAN